MKIWHRIGLDKCYEDVLQQLGVAYERGMTMKNGHYSSVLFNIAEDDPAWPKIEEITLREKTFNFPCTTFTQEEILASKWSRLCPGFERSYPQPKSNMRWRQETFPQRCPSCGLKFDQKVPFRIPKELRMGKYDFVCLYWTYGILCTPRVVNKIQEAGLKGVQIWPVMLHREDVPSEGLSQLISPTIAQPGLAPSDMEQPEYCQECGVTKYGYHRRGYMHIKREALHTNVDVQQTYEWFGSDTKTGYREILISNKFARLIIEEGWRGINLKAVELV